MGDTPCRLPSLTITTFILLFIPGCILCSGNEVCDYMETKDGNWVADCSGRGLKDVPPNIDHNTTILYLHSICILKYSRYMMTVSRV